MTAARTFLNLSASPGGRALGDGIMQDGSGGVDDAKSRRRGRYPVIHSDRTNDYLSAPEDSGRQSR